MNLDKENQKRVDKEDQLEMERIEARRRG